MNWISMLTSRQGGRALVVLVLLMLPFVCFVPWILVTGPADYGRKLGLLSDFKLQTLVDPATLANQASKEAAAQAKPAQTSDSVGRLDILLTREAANRLNSLTSTALLVFVTLGAGIYGWMAAWHIATKSGD